MTTIEPTRQQKQPTPQTPPKAEMKGPSMPGRTPTPTRPTQDASMQNHSFDEQKTLPTADSLKTDLAAKAKRADLI